MSGLGAGDLVDLRKKIAACGLVLGDDFYAKTERFITILLKWNKVHNLSGAKDQSAAEKHIFDSVYPLLFLGGFFPNDFTKAIDIGSGAGFPGLILAMAKTNANFTLVEPNGKKSAFLRFAAQEIGVNNAIVEDKRIEDITIEKYDLITSRALSGAEEIYDLASAFMDISSILLLYKGKNTAKEADLIGAKVISAPHAEYLAAKIKGAKWE